MKKFLVAIFLISAVLAVDCNYCKDSISEKPYNVYGRKYHKSCFICHHCNEAIKEGLKYSFDEHMYHANNSCNVLCESCYLRKGIEYPNGIIQCEECHDKIVQTPEDIEKKLNNFGHHLEYKESGLNLNDIKKMVSSGRAIYDYHADMRSSKWSGDEKLKKTDISELPIYLQENINKYSNWII